MSSEHGSPSRDQARGRETRTRVLIAAAAEFAEFGVAGARINRIAEVARASKERIYAWFGDKESLFDEVMRHGLDELARAVPIDDDLVGYCLRLHDHFTALPSAQRVAIQAWLHDSAIADRLAPARQEGYRHKLDVIARAQRDGLVEPSWEPAFLLSLLLSTATAWLMAPAELRGIAEAEADQAARRASTAEAARRLVLPRHSNA